MPNQPASCPNPDCLYHKQPVPNFFIKMGYYTHKDTNNKIARYRCRNCGKSFSNRTTSADKHQRLRNINKPLTKLIASGVTLRRSAKILGVAYNTVLHRFVWLGEQARIRHQEILANPPDNIDIKTGRIQFDEMQTYERNKYKKLTIALAVRWKTGQILSARVAPMSPSMKPAKHITQEQLDKWKTFNKQRQACLEALTEAAQFRKEGQILIETDRLSSYKNLINEAFQDNYKHVGKSREEDAEDAAIKNPHDPLAQINFICAKLRADLSRLARRTWTTTKKAENLQAHLDLYIAFHNGYKGFEVLQEEKARRAAKRKRERAIKLANAKERLTKKQSKLDQLNVRLQLVKPNGV